MCSSQNVFNANSNCTHTFKNAHQQKQPVHGMVGSIADATQISVHFSNYSQRNISESIVYDCAKTKTKTKTISIRFNSIRFGCLQNV